MEITSHLLPSHVEYFDKWSRLIATEAAGVANKKPKTSFFWCRTSEEQEKSGKQSQFIKDITTAYKVKIDNHQLL